MITQSIFVLASLAAATPTTPAAAPAPLPPVAVSRMLGELALARGTLGFAACNGAAAAAYGSAGAGDLAQVVSEFNDGADGVLFVDADIAQESDGRWRIDRLHRAYRDGPRCAEDLRAFVWRAIANDGSWTLEVSRRYVTLRPADRRALFFAYRAFTRDEDDNLRFAAQAEGQAIELQLRGLRCSDSTARRSTPWQIDVTLGGQLSSGCAWTGVPR